MSTLSHRPPDGFQFCKYMRLNTFSKTKVSSSRVLYEPKPRFLWLHRLFSPFFNLIIIMEKSHPSKTCHADSQTEEKCEKTGNLNRQTSIVFQIIRRKKLHFLAWLNTLQQKKRKKGMSVDNDERKGGKKWNVVHGTSTTTLGLEPL